MSIDTEKVNFESLVQSDRVHSSVFTSEDVFEMEIDRIFHNWWVFVGHESEVPKPGDYKRKSIGRQEVIMSRTKDGEVRLLMNRCRHRGAIVCSREEGNAKFFRCPFHGWTYRNNGDLVGVPFPGAYGKDFDKSQFGLAPVPLEGSYQGFVFGCLNPDVPKTLDEHLEGAKEFIDWFVEASPVGEIEVRAGVTKARYHGNWKYVGMDGYHPAFVHRSIEDMMEHTAPEKASKALAGYTEASPQRAVDMGNGHVRLDEQQGDEDTLLGNARRAEGGMGEYFGLLTEAYGPEAGPKKFIQSDPHLHIWPNLQLIGSHLRVIKPVSVGHTEIHSHLALLKGVPEEVNIGRIRGHEWFHGPASFGSPDDMEIFERVQRGSSAEVNPWIFLGRGLDRETTIQGGYVSGNITDEVPQRGQLRQWLSVMTQERSSEEK